MTDARQAGARTCTAGASTRASVVSCSLPASRGRCSSSPAIPYFMLIVTYVFPPYFAQFVVGDPVQGQATVAEATKWAGVIGALTAPVLGAMMDRGGSRKPVMLVFLAMLFVSGLSLWWSMPGSVDAQGVFPSSTTGLGVYGTMAFLVLGFVGYSYSEMMHNAMLRGSGRPDALSQISGAGIGLGQLSSALCLGGVACGGAAGAGRCEHGATLRCSAGQGRSWRSGCWSS
jgi:MFS-type transporter involved in bile tolerance (Atg22 family)